MTIQVKYVNYTPLLMIEYVFDYESWLLWNNCIFFGKCILGLISCVIAFTGYSFWNSWDRNTMTVSVLMCGVVVLVLGFYPIEWGVGSDRANYAHIFMDFQDGMTSIRNDDSELGFRIYDYILSRFIDVRMYFIVTAAVYVMNYAVAIYRTVRNNSAWLLIAVVLSMGFTGYSLNTMRAGLAISFLILAISFYESKIKAIILCLIAFSIHKSTLLPSAMFFVAMHFNKTALYYKLWLISIPVSFVAGNFFNSFFEGFVASSDDRAGYLTNVENTHYNVGFRIDFILYSLAPMAVGAYYIFIQNFRERFYEILYNMYLLSNMFWIFVIRANYSDRFAYLSWFLIPFVLCYPLLTQKMNLQENCWLGFILLGETLFGLII